MEPKEISSTLVKIGTVHLINKEDEVRGWQEDRKMKTERHGVRWSLFSGTSVNITVRGRIVRKETPYTAQLVMVYRDGTLTRHKVSSTFVSTLLEHITQDTNGPYFLKTGLPAPTTTPRPTTTSP